MNDQDSIKFSAQFNQRLFGEIYNRKIWQWYSDWGIRVIPPKKPYLTFNRGLPIFNEEVQKQALKSSAIAKMKSSVLFPFRALQAIQSYDPSVIDTIYEQEKKKKYETLSAVERKQKIEQFERLLIENFRMSILASLIEYYHLQILIPEQYYEDTLAARYTLTKKQFLAQYGYLAENGYEVTSPRYYETNAVPPRAIIKPTPGPHQFREYVKLRSVKLIALLRKLRGNPAAKSNIKSSKSAAETLSGKGEITGTVRHVKGSRDYHKVRGGDIVVTTHLSPDLITIFSKAAAIISEQGGLLSHLAIVARERGMPVLRHPGAMKLRGKIIVNFDRAEIKQSPVHFRKRYD